MRRPPTSLARTLVLAAATVFAAAGLAACGGDDGGSSSSPAAASATDGADGADGAGGGDAGFTADDNPFIEGSESATQLGDAIDNLGIGAKVTALEVALSPDSVEIVDETTARLTFDEGDVDMDALTKCPAVGAVLSEGETVILVFPNGETDCS